MSKKLDLSNLIYLIINKTQKIKNVEETRSIKFNLPNHQQNTKRQ